MTILDCCISLKMIEKNLVVLGVVDKYAPASVKKDKLPMNELKKNPLPTGLVWRNTGIM